MYNAGLAQGDRLLSDLRRPHAQNLEVRYNLQSENSYIQPPHIIMEGLIGHMVANNEACIL